MYTMEYTRQWFLSKLNEDRYIDLSEYAPQPKVNIRSLPQTIYKIVKNLLDTWACEWDGFYLVHKWMRAPIPQPIPQPTPQPDTIIKMTAKVHEEYHTQQPTHNSNLPDLVDDSILLDNNRILMEQIAKLEFDNDQLKKYKEDTKNLKSDLDDALFWKADIEKKYQDALNIIQIQEERLKELEW